VIGVHVACRPTGCHVDATLFVVPATVRLWLYRRGGGETGSFANEPPVYFAAADAMVHGRLPYSDFTLLHPARVVLALSPFAVLTHLLDDRTAFAAANIAFALPRAVNTVFDLRIGRQLGSAARPSSAPSSTASCTDP
jgi:hypothetical protein